jgi:hypothetical protein
MQSAHVQIVHPVTLTLVTTALLLPANPCVLISKQWHGMQGGCCGGTCYAKCSGQVLNHPLSHFNIAHQLIADSHSLCAGQEIVA